MNQPVLSIDVSKSNSYAASFISYGQPFKKPIKFNHTIKGITPIITLLKNLENETN
jgi:hypothetical protein